jgi:hypothetical protein
MILLGALLVPAAVQLAPPGGVRMGIVLAGVLLLCGGMLWGFVLARRELRTGGAGQVWLLAAVAPALLIAAVLLYMAAAAATEGALNWPGILGWGWWVAAVLGTGVFIPVELALWGRGAQGPAVWPRAARGAQAGLVLALLLVLVATLVFLGERLAWQWDLSHFRTATPGEATRSAVAALSEPVTVAAFFPAEHPVGRRVWDYLRQLPTGPTAGGGALTLERHDADLAPDEAEAFKAPGNGRIVLRKGEVTKSVSIGEELSAARNNLRRLDATFHAALLELGQARRILYVTVGHGERTEQPDGGEPRPEARRVSEFRKLAQARNYTIKTLGFADGLGSAIPADAGIVAVMGPQVPFRPAEVQALRDYLGGGGRLLLWLEPAPGGGAAGLAPLLGEYGVGFDPTPRANDRIFGRRTYTPADHGLLVTNAFGDHAAVRALARAASQNPVLLLGAGALTRRPAQGVAVGDLVRAMPGTWADDGNFQFDAAREVREAPVLLMGVSKAPPAPTGAAAAPEGARLVVAADADMASDLLLTHRPNQVLLVLLLDWLGGAPTPTAPPQDEQDVQLLHARQDEWIWFYLPVFTAPALVLLLGLLAARRRRRSTGEDGHA